MTELEAGMTVKVKPSIKKYASVGFIEDIKNGIANVKYSLRYGRGSTNEKIAVENLIHVCKRMTSNGFDSSPCGRPVKEGNLCGLHAAADRRVTQRREADRVKQEEADAYRAETRRLTLEMQAKIDKAKLTGIATPLHARNNTVSISLDTLLSYVNI